jgi:hypothetical protein
MRQLLLTVAAVATLGFTSPATAQGVPTFDGSQLGQLVAQLEHMAEDLNVQMQQLATMRLELETQLSQLTNLEAQLTSLIEGSGLGELFATVEEFRALRGKLVAPLNTAQSLASGDFLSGFNPGAELSASVERVLSGSGFTSERLSTLSGSDEPADTVLSYIFRQIERVVEDRRPTIIVLDEAWKLLDDPYFGARLENWLVTLRKMNCVVIMMTQYPSQLRDSRVGKTIVETVPTQILFPNDRATVSDYDFLRVNAKEAALLVQPTIGQRIALIRSAGDSVFVDADLSALGDLLPILGGGATGEARVPADWRANPDFWRHVI